MLKWTVEGKRSGKHIEHDMRNIEELLPWIILLVATWWRTIVVIDRNIRGYPQSRA